MNPPPTALAPFRITDRDIAIPPSHRSLSSDVSPTLDAGCPWLGTWRAQSISARSLQRLEFLSPQLPYA